MSELKNCPFCGNAARVVEDDLYVYGNEYHVECIICKAKSCQMKNKEDAIKCWNKRYLFGKVIG